MGAHVLPEPTGPAFDLTPPPTCGAHCAKHAPRPRYRRGKAAAALAIVTDPAQWWASLGIGLTVALGLMVTAH